MMGLFFNFSPGTMVFTAGCILDPDLIAPECRLGTSILFIYFWGEWFKTVKYTNLKFMTG